MFMAAATGDWTRNMLREEYPAVRAIYELFDKAANVEAMHQDAPHNYNQVAREAVYRFFGKQVLGETDAAKFKERGIRLEKLQDMLALHNRTLPANALDYAGVFAQWVRTAQTLVGQIAVYMVDRELTNRMRALAFPAETLTRAPARDPQTALTRALPMLRRGFATFELLATGEQEFRYPPDSKLSSPPEPWSSERTTRRSRWE